MEFGEYAYLYTVDDEWVATHRSVNKLVKLTPEMCE